jgi:hypothetical protein
MSLDATHSPGDRSKTGGRGLGVNSDFWDLG